MSRPRFDLDRYVEVMDDSLLDDIAGVEEPNLPNYKRDRKLKAKRCHKCGCRDFKRLYQNEKKKVIGCDKCNRPAKD